VINHIIIDPVVGNHDTSFRFISYTTAYIL